MSGRSRVLVTLVALAAVGGSLVACSSGAGTPGTLPATSPPATSPMTSPSMSQPTTSEAEVEQAVRQFVDAINTAVSTAESGPFLAITTQACTCRGLLDSVNARDKRGERATGGTWTIRDLAASLPTAAGRSVAQMAVHEDAYQVVDSAGKTVDSGAARETSWIVVLSKRGDRWLVADADPA